MPKKTNSSEPRKAGSVTDGIIETWEDEAGATYEVNVDEGWVNAIQADSFGKDVFAAMQPVDARRLAAALEKAATEAEKHPRWSNPEW